MRLSQIFIMMLFLTATSCMVKHTKDTPSNAKVDVKEIVYTSFGGKSLNDSLQVVIKDNVLTYQIFAKDPAQSRRKEIALAKGEFHSLVQKIDIATFKEAKNGKSIQELDGPDKTLRIITPTTTIVKTNAFENKTWILLTTFINEKI